MVLNRNSTPGEFVDIRKCSKVGIISDEDWKKAKSLLKRRFRDRRGPRILRSLNIRDLYISNEDELNSHGLYPCSNSEGENCRSMSTSSINRRIESFHVVVVQWTSKKCTKKRESSCFARKTNCYWRCCCSSSLSLLIKGDVTRAFGNDEFLAQHRVAA